MRLTLRNLLAYLNGLLQPRDQDDIREKIERGGRAQELADRIPRLVRQTGLDAPRVDSRAAGADANLVAEYLDGMLSPEKAAEFDKNCLQSDRQLAEVASSFEILSVVQRRPIKVDSRLRKRLYRLSETHELPGNARDKGQGPHRSSGAGAAISLNPGRQEKEETRSQPVPSPTDAQSAPEPNRAPATPKSKDDAAAPILKKKPATKASDADGAQEPDSPAKDAAKISPRRSAATDQHSSKKAAPPSHDSVNDQDDENWFETGDVDQFLEEQAAQEQSPPTDPGTPVIGPPPSVEQEENLEDEALAEGQVAAPPVESQSAEDFQIEINTTSRRGSASTVADASVAAQADEFTGRKKRTGGWRQQVPAIAVTLLAVAVIGALVWAGIGSKNGATDNNSGDEIASNDDGEPSNPDADGQDASSIAPGIDNDDPASDEGDGLEENGSNPSLNPPGVGERDGGEGNNVAGDTAESEGGGNLIGSTEPGAGEAPLNRPEMNGARGNADGDRLTLPSLDGDKSGFPVLSLPDEEVAEEGVITEADFMSTVDPENPPRIGGPAVGKLVSGKHLVARFDEERYDESAGGWFRLRPEGELFLFDQLLNFPFYKTDLALGDQMKVTMVGATGFELHGSYDTGKRLKLRFGTIILESNSSDGCEFLFEVDSSRHLVNLATPQSRVAIRRIRYALPGIDPRVEPAQVIVDVIVMQGRVSWEDSTGARVFETGQAVRYVDGVPQEPELLATMPYWIEEGITDIDLRGGETAAEILPLDSPLESELLNLQSDSRVEVRMLGIQSLSLLGNHEPAIAAFENDRNKFYWADLIEWLKNAAARSPAHAEAMADMFQVVSPEHGEEAFRLLIGFSPAQVNEGANAALVNLLESESLMIRILAADNLQRITGTRGLYRPETTEKIREGHVRTWKRQLDKGLVQYAKEPAPPSITGSRSGE